MFTPGETYKRSDIHDLYGGNRQSGICPSRKNNSIFLFTGNSGKEYGYEDGWKSDGCFYYTGEGQVGHMKFERGNKAIKDHSSNGKNLHLFEQFGNGIVKYISEMKYLDHQIKNGWDREKNEREIIVFRLANVKI
jgi:5-methylcytosine-specific restriction protein A